MAEARSSVDIASFYWTLTNKDTGTHEPSANKGETVLKTLAKLSGKVSVRIAVNTPQHSQPQDDLRLLNASGDTFALYQRVETNVSAVGSTTVVLVFLRRHLA
ncbi:phospholipase D3-like [Notothenia coriiceps]|uniref:Phospholipase D3-like n=1 Tax=Notothenia coriiceps TaxID=8208 RepID=A0A6I9N808_9TELE|nr:PREDICTED: phospholipase D3-like [Notothenia coriiceps]